MGLSSTPISTFLKFMLSPSRKPAHGKRVQDKAFWHNMDGMDTDRLKRFVEPFWEDSILPSIAEYIRIPNKSPAYDAQWVEHGYMEDAVKLMEAWARQQLGAFAGATLEVIRL